MFEIADHIGYLLTLHDCVVVPGLGGFVSHYTGALFSSGSLQILPPSKQLGFNPDLSHNDGLLAGSLMRKTGVSYAQANAVIGEEVSRLKKQLEDQTGGVCLGNLGVLRLNENGHYEFDPVDGSLFYPQAFGLSALTIKPLNQLRQQLTPVPVEEKRRVVNPDVFYIPISKRLLRRVASVAAAVLILMLISTPIDDSDTPVNYASVVSAELFGSPVEPLNGQIPLQTQEVVQENTVVATEIETPEVTIPKPEPTVATPVSESLNIQPVKNPGKTYYIVVASLPTIEAARQQQLTFEKEGLGHTGIYEKDNKARLYVKSFTDKPEAEKYLNWLKLEDSRFADAWLLSGR